MYVFDGTNSSGTLLWRCSGCQTVPRPIISISNTLYVSFLSSKSGVPKGVGFKALYWELLSDTTVWQNRSGGVILEVPATLTFDTTPSNSTPYWGLTATTMQSRLSFQPRYKNTDISEGLTDLVVDGRVSGSAFESHIDTGIVV